MFIHLSPPVIEVDAEGLYITPSGYFYAAWCSNEKQYVSQFLTLRDIEQHLHSEVRFIGDVRLRHILVPLLHSAIFAVIFKRVYWSETMRCIETQPWVEWIGDRLKTDPSLNRFDDMEYIELTNLLTHMNESNTILNSLDRFSFYGVSYELETIEEAQSYYQHVGQRTLYSLTSTPINTIANHPIRLGGLSVISKFESSRPEEELIHEAPILMSLSTLLYSIFWELSFYGDSESV